MSKLTLKTQQRGSTLKLNFSLMRFNTANTDITSDSINVNNLALVAIRLKGDYNKNVQLSVFVMKTNEKAEMHTVLIKIICDGFVKQVYLSDDWLETLIKKVSPDGEVVDKIVIYQYLCNMEVTVHKAEMSMPLLANNQLYEDQKFIDFQLYAADGTVAVHKAVLFMHSDMFRTMLSGEWKETREGQIKIEGVTVQTLQHLKDYMYLGTLPDEGLEPLLLIAARYLMDKLKADCSTKLVKTMKPENFDNIVQFASENNIVELVRALILEIPEDVFNQLKNPKNIEQE